MKIWWLVVSGLIGLVIWWLLPKSLPETIQASSTMQAPPRVMVQELEQGLEFWLDGQQLPPNLAWRVWLSTNAGAVVGRATTTGQRLLVPWTRAGLIHYQVDVGSHQIHGQIRRLPSKAITPLKLNIGARAVRVNANRVPALVLHPIDQQGNVSNDPIQVQINRPDGTLLQRQIKVKHLLAWTWLPSGTKTGLLKVQVNTQEARGERGEVDVLPNLTAEAQFQVQARTATSDRERLLLSLTNAKDQFGNPILNGTSVEFFAQNSIWALFSTRTLVRQSAEVKLPIPEQGIFQSTGLIDNWKSQQKTIKAEPNIRPSSIPIQLNNQILEVGAVIDQQGALLDDGTPVQIEIPLLDNSTYSIRLPLENGRLQWQLPPLPSSARVLYLSIQGLRLTVALQ